jgi:hypothetical protein
MVSPAFAKVTVDVIDVFYLINYLFANGPEGVANASSIRQTFSQIPSPGAASLFAIVGLAGVRRRR